jgi:phosphoglycerate dehydrogenase-like enzyme
LTFAFLHPLQPEQRAAITAAFPDVEFIGGDKDALPGGIERAEAAAIGQGTSIASLLEAAPSLRWLHNRGAGVEQLLTPALVDSPVVLTNGSGNHASNIAEHVLALVLAFARDLPALIRAQADRHWRKPQAGRVFELTGQTLVIVGLGAIGQALATRAAALGLKVIGVRRSPAADLPAGVQRVSTLDGLDAALAEADHVAITLPLTPDTQRLFDARRIAAIKRGAYVYNIGRGPIVDQQALLDALRSGHLAGAGLDVTEPEPLPESSPLWSEPTVVITAHSSGLTPHSFERYQALLTDNLRRFQRGEPLRNVVDKRLGY